MKMKHITCRVEEWMLDALPDPKSDSIRAAIENYLDYLEEVDSFDEDTVQIDRDSSITCQWIMDRLIAGNSGGTTIEDLLGAASDELFDGHKVSPVDEHMLCMRLELLIKNNKVMRNLRHPELHHPVI